MVSEKQGNDSDPIEITQYTEIYLLTQIRLILVEIRDEVKTIGTMLVIASILAIALALAYAIGSIASLIW